MWVDAYIRRCRTAGAFVSISRRGDDSAGAIFIECLHGDGVDLYGPRMREDGGRGFERIMEAVPGFQVAERIEREARFDGDLWLVTVEDREGRVFLMDDEIE
ncbi:DUF1491 family protein [Acuticoccus yangtzensis]|uniref:DUF1491 family protein n=1 Tax=Acuticoccus yangtzensis TaxID=1443441 RepID=UPI000A9EC031|nr:DUF1491 family protein [Acuticoccus yangtzensis]